MFYKLKIFDIERELPVLKTPSGIYIAGFNPVGDMELLIKAGDYLAKQIITEKIDFDIILTTELKGVPIAQEVARNLSCNYVCLRKSPKCYMLEPKHTSGASITSGNTDYYVSSIDLDKLKNKKVGVSSSKGYLSEEQRLVSKKSGEYKSVAVYTDPLTGRKISTDIGWSHNPASGLVENKT